MVEKIWMVSFMIVVKLTHVSTKLVQVYQMLDCYVCNYSLNIAKGKEKKKITVYNSVVGL